MNSGQAFILGLLMGMIVMFAIAASTGSCWFH